METTTTKSEKLKHLAEDFQYYLSMTQRHLELIAVEIVEMLESIFGTGFVEHWQIGDYEEENCISIRIKPLHERGKYIELVEAGYEPLSQMLYSLIKGLHPDFPTIYIYGEDLMPPERAETVKQKMNEWLWA